MQKDLSVIELHTQFNQNYNELKIKKKMKLQSYIHGVYSYVTTKLKNN